MTADKAAIDETVTSAPLHLAAEVELYPTAPFSFDGSLFKPSHFPSGDIRWEPGFLWRTLRLKEQPIGIKLANTGTTEDPSILLSLYAQNALSTEQVASVIAQIRYLYELDLDLKPFYACLEADPLMRPVVKRWYGMRPNGDPFYESLIVFVVLQNATVRRSVQMLENLFRAYGDHLSFDGQALHAYWLPEVLAAAPEEDLRALKVGYRAKSFLRVSQQFAAGELDFASLQCLPNPELRQAVLKIYGIGPASAWYLMFEVFHRYDSFEHVSPWEQKIFSRLLFDQDLVPVESIIAEASRRWGKWKMLAAHYLFEDLFWRRRNEPVPWLEELIRL